MGDTFFHGCILAVLFGVAEAHSYLTRDGRHYDTTATETIDNVTDWKECEKKCRAYPDCRTFTYGQFNRNDRVCRMMKDRLAYGPLNGVGAVTGELESLSDDASLLWAGIGKPNPWDIGPYVYVNATTTNMTHAQCQAECDAVEAEFGVKCAVYRITTEDGVSLCETFASALQLLDSYAEPTVKYGIREDINMTETGIVGDPFGTRVPPNEFPAAQPDIGDSVPDYSEIDFHFELGLKGWKNFRSASGTTTWAECSTKCHQTTGCVAFVFYIRNQSKNRICQFFDALLLGRTEPGFGKYGIIDRSKGEGAVMSLVDASNTNGHNLYSEKDFIETMDECAKLCYRFYQPKMCIGFFFDLPNKQCKLYDAIPAVAEGQIERPIAFDAQYEWNADKYRFAYLGNRVSTNMRMSMCKYQMCDPKAATYETKTANCRNGTSSMQMEFGGSGMETNEQQHLICVTHCFAKRQWCHWYQMNPHSRICYLYTKDADQQTSGGESDEKCIYGESTR